MDLNSYQEKAQETNLLSGQDQELRLIAPMLGLASETGSLLDIHKKVLTESVDPQSGDEIFKQELGDLLWYVAAVAAAKGYSLEAVAQSNLERTRALWEEIHNPPDMSALPIPDAGFPDQERFPRRFEIAFEEFEVAPGQLSARMVLQMAEPNHFPEGPVDVQQGKTQGFTVGENLGDRLTDNSRRVNGYRFHDAIHLGFLAVLGWSPTVRSVLRVKRRSNSTTDEVEDGARAIFSEEGLAAVLSRLARRRMAFQNNFNVDGETLEVAAACIEGLEVEGTPGWAWRKAIIAGFTAKKLLEDNRGGILVADLDAHSLTFKTPA